MTPRRSDRSPGLAFMAPLCLGAALNPINSSIIATALSPIAVAVGVPIGETAALIAALYIASAVCQPVTGQLAQIFGPRRIFLAGTALVLLGGALGTYASSLEALVAARALIGAGTSTSYPSAILLIHQHAVDTKTNPARKLGALAIAAQVSVTLGLPLGGLLVSIYGWHTTFAVNIPLAVVAMVATWLWVPKDGAHARRPLTASSIRELDAPGMTLFAATLCAGVVFLLSLQHPHWLVLALAAVLVVCLVLWELAQQVPFFDVRSLAKNRPLTVTYARNCGTMLIMYCTLFGVSQWLQEVRGLDAGRAGALIVPMTAVAAVVSFGAARSGRVRRQLVLAAASAFGATVLLATMSSATPLVLVVLATMALGIMVGLSAIGNQAALYAQAQANELGIAAGLLRTSTNVGAILAASVVSLVYVDGVTDGRFFELSLIMVAASGTVLIATMSDRSLPRQH